MPHSNNQKGFEYSIILSSKAEEEILVVVQAKFSVTGAIQEKGEIGLTCKKSIEVLSKDPAKEEDDNVEVEEVEMEEMEEMEEMDTEEATKLYQSWLANRENCCVVSNE
jgi:hypothetical protein